jgi:bacteriocin-like protein
MSKPANKKSKAPNKTTKSKELDVKELDVKDLEKVTGGSLNFRPPQPAKPNTSR